MTNFLEQLSSFVWGLPLMVLLVGTGLYLTFKLSGIQFKGFFNAWKIISGKYDRTTDPGEISHFRALTTALSATIGTGNIVGVAAAILTGGPGAVFWMWVTALVGMATKFTSCTLAVHFRKIDAYGETHGGPMHFIEIGMGKSFKWLAILFATFTALASFGIGNMFQVNNVVSAVNGLIYGEGHAIQTNTRVIAGGIIAVLVAVVILGGIRRIAQVTSKLVPVMCAFYFFAGIIILIKNVHLILPGFQLIFEQAFHAPQAIEGGLLGGVIRAGVARGLFSNEAGLGSAAMAHSAARTKEPVREGLVAMLGPFIDTIVICSITALVIICTGVYETVTIKGQLTTAAFERGLPGSGWMVSVGIILFAFSTLIAWSYYGDRAVDYLFGHEYVSVYRMVYVIFILIGAMRPLDDVINFCDALNGLMALPNLVALIVLAPVVLKLTKDYFQRY
ncbi:MAG: sodium:alanine symporter family protein [Candidatus Omnitrophica bacterium]|nr:sodium:alanine symporter family protein [Candidatus Omnitrophota bacterium]MCB9747875.1 sodium:alanine symporter family protein [Candidatus Omnitrophota bacterium]